MITKFGIVNCTQLYEIPAKLDIPGDNNLRVAPVGVNIFRTWFGAAK